ncbi:MAG: hypothetical protein LC808_37990, partial [Actinobacteria bacterium]|nr:hypothetical protein [Actinomycetota bacterium]
GQCQANNEPTTFVCRPDAGDCDVAETCAPGGVCPADQFEAAGTACGDPSDSVCDNPDSCNATGQCQANNEPTTFVCRPDAGDCDVAETCAPGGVCPADIFEPAGTSCSDQNACTTDDKCNATGQCVGGAPPNCNDQNACTIDSCDPTVGCTNAPAPTATGCEGKMTGGGQMDDAYGQNASFGFNAQIKNGVSSGHFNYVDHVTGLHINGKVELVYFVDAATRTIKFRGTDSKTGCQFDVTVTDKAEPGANQDRFGLTTTCAETQTYRPIRRGNIQWHPT